MADFNTHVLTATGVGGLAASLCMKVLALDMGQALALTTVTVVGGILPDIDLKASRPSRLLFTLLGVVAALVWALEKAEHYPLLLIWASAMAVFFLVRYALWWVFHQLAEHRGALHSIVATGMFGQLTVAGSHHLLGNDVSMAWWLGGFCALGCLVHLVLDELYSIDLAGGTLRRSFGSALKLIDLQRWQGSLAVLAVCVALLPFTPTPDPGWKAPALQALKVLQQPATWF